MRNYSCTSGSEQIHQRSCMNIQRQTEQHHAWECENLCVCACVCVCAVWRCVSVCEGWGFPRGDWKQSAVSCSTALPVSRVTPGLLGRTKCVCGERGTSKITREDDSVFVIVNDFKMWAKKKKKNQAREKWFIFTFIIIILFYFF